jgi:hypothetical protein
LSELAEIISNIAISPQPTGFEKTAITATSSQCRVDNFLFSPAGVMISE